MEHQDDIIVIKAKQPREDGKVCDIFIKANSEAEALAKLKESIEKAHREANPDSHPEQ